MYYKYYVYSDIVHTHIYMYTNTHLQAMAPTWQQRSGEYDGLTTNGIAFMRPVGTFESGVSPGEWREVTVMGNVRNMRGQRSSRIPGGAVSVKCMSQ